MLPEKTCNQFVKEMKEAGFDFTYRATDGKRVVTGEVKKSGEVITATVPTVEESRQKIKDLFKKG